MRERPQPPVIIAKAARRQFDESKVNRDKGKFASKPGASGGATAVTPAQLQAAKDKKRPARSDAHKEWLRSSQLTSANVDALTRAEDKASGRQERQLKESEQKKTQYSTNWGGVLSDEKHKKAAELDSKLSDDELEDKLMQAYDSENEDESEIFEAVMQYREAKRR